QTDMRMSSAMIELRIASTIGRTRSGWGVARGWRRRIAWGLRRIARRRRIGLRRSALALLEEGHSEQTTESRKSHRNDRSYQPIDQRLTKGFSEWAILIHPNGLVDLGGGVGVLTGQVSHPFEKGHHDGLAKQELQRYSNHEVHDRANRAGKQADNGTIA